MNESNPAHATIGAALALRDALRGASDWRHVKDALEATGLGLDEVRRRLAPRISIDPHTHSIHSDGIFRPVELVWWARAVGLRAIGIADHDNLSPALAGAIREGRAANIAVIPGLEFTIHRLGGQAWRGLEVGLHLFPADRVENFLDSPDGEAFCSRFEPLNTAKSEQAWTTLQAVNERFMASSGLEPIERDELWEASGKTDPVCVGTITVLILDRLFAANRGDLLERLPDTRAIYTMLGAEGYVAPLETQPQGLDDLCALREELRSHDIRSTLTLNHPEEWMSKCGLTDGRGQPDRSAILRLVWLLMLDEPERNPVAFIELYNSRNTPESRRFFEGLLAEIVEMREHHFPDVAPLEPIASSDAHRVTGSIDAEGRVQGWVDGEDFLFGLGRVDARRPGGNLAVPADYPDADDLIEHMTRRAT